MTASAPALRPVFKTSRLAEFCTKEDLTRQTGHEPRDWPLVVLKELVDNALDACEEAGIDPEIEIVVGDAGITIEDNGPGLPAEVITDILDFNARVSSRSAWVAPTRGAQGNAAKTLVAMPFVLDGTRGETVIESCGHKHTILFTVDPIRQEPRISRTVEDGFVKSGTKISIVWPITRQRKRAVFTKGSRLYLGEPAS
jgi:DNA topoisomerase VI subunit B